MQTNDKPLPLWTCIHSRLWAREIKEMKPDIKSNARAHAQTPHHTHTRQMQTTNEDTRIENKRVTEIFFRFGEQRHTNTQYQQRTNKKNMKFIAFVLLGVNRAFFAHSEKLSCHGRNAWQQKIYRIGLSTNDSFVCFVDVCVCVCLCYRSYTQHRSYLPYLISAQIYTHQSAFQFSC